MENDASTPPPSNGTRIWWRDFKGTPPYRKMKRVLRENGFYLEIVFDENNVAHDVYIVAFPLPPVVAAVSAAFPPHAARVPLQ